MSMPAAGKSARKGRFAASGGFLPELLAFLALLGLLLAWLANGLAVEEKRRQLISAMLGRAEALCGAVEGSGRFPGPKGGKALTEMARKAGAAWAAIVDSDGAIIEGGKGAKSALRLYGPEEIAALAPGDEIRGRFSPADPDLYEAWKLFQPRSEASAWEGRLIIFTGWRARGINRRLAAYSREVWLYASLAILAVLAAAALGFFLRSYRASARQLDYTRALAEQVIMSYPAALFVADAAGATSLANPPGRLLLEGFGADGLAAMPGLDWGGLVAALDEGRVISGRECELGGKRGAPLSARLTAALIRDSGGKILGYLLIIQDMDEIRKLEKKLRQSERLSALGHLAAGLAHEIRNPLSSIRGYAAYLAEKRDGDPLARGAAELLAEETGRLNRVLTDLLGLAKPLEIRPACADLAQLAEKAANLALPDAAAKNIAFARDWRDPGPFCRIDSDRLLQALLNLLMNAIQASPAGGEITLSVSRGADSAQIRVADDGPGMDQETAARIFTPYFTTKSRGSGLGLPIAQQIAEAHGGAISVSSSPGQGAVFTLELPLAANDCVSPDHATESAANHSDAARIAESADASAPGAFSYWK